MPSNQCLQHAPAVTHLMSDVVHIPRIISGSLNAATYIRMYVQTCVCRGLYCIAMWMNGPINL